MDIYNILLNLLSGFIGALVVCVINIYISKNREIYNIKLNILKNLIIYRYNNLFPYYDKEFQKYFLLIDIVFYKDKKILSKFNELISELPPYLLKHNDENKYIFFNMKYKELINLIIKHLKLSDIIFDRDYMKEAIVKNKYFKIDI